MFRSLGIKSDIVSRIFRFEFISDIELIFNVILGSKNEFEKLFKLEIQEWFVFGNWMGKIGLLEFDINQDKDLGFQIVEKLGKKVIDFIK